VPDRSQDWFDQAQRDLEFAVQSARSGFHEWACFVAHQAAEKALKALHLRCGEEAWGHLLARLLRELPAPIHVPPELMESARVLDACYIPPRYPNSYPEGAPYQHYGPRQSQEAIGHARAIVEFVRTQMA